MYWVRGCRIESVAGQDNENEDERIDPCMSKGESFPPSEEGLCFPPLRRSDLRIALDNRVRYSACEE